MLKKGKEWNYEGGIRIPLIVRWPGNIKKNTVNNHIGYFPDFMPTFSEIIEGKLPNKTDGISLVPTLLGNDKKQAKHDYLYWERPQYLNEKGIRKIHPTKLRQAVRFGKWKAIREDKTEEIELYNLEIDIEESKNIASDYPKIIKKAEVLIDKSHFKPIN